MIFQCMKIRSKSAWNGVKLPKNEKAPNYGRCCFKRKDKNRKKRLEKLQDGRRKNDSTTN